MPEKELQLPSCMDCLQALLSELNDLFLIYDSEGFIEFASKKTMDLLGYMPEELLGMSVLDLSYGQYRYQLKNELSRRLEQGLPGSYKVPIRGKDREEYIVQLNAVPIKLGEKALGGLVLGENTSEQRATIEALRLSEEKFSAAFRLSPEMIAITSLFGGRYIDVNDAFLKLFGYTREEVIGKTITELNIWASPQERLQVVKTLQRETIFKNFEGLFNKKTGGTWRGLCSFARLEIAGETCVLTVAADITEKRRMEEEILKVSHLESLTLLAGGLAHDFNNLLTIILGNISLARLVGMDKSDSKEFIGEAEKAALQARGLTQQLLTFAQSGTPVKKPASIRDFLSQTVNFCLRGSNVKSELLIREDLWDVLVDEGQINQVLNNLVINAVQAMPDGGIIRVKADNYLLEDEEKGLGILRKGQYVRLSLQDQGKGIASEDLDKIFDPFFTNKEGGTGLGLSTSYSIIHKHGGHISCQSQPGVGTQFTLYLPASTEEAEGKKPGCSLTSGRGKILFMDDEQRIRAMVVEMLTPLGYEVILAADGQECIDRYRQAMDEAQCFDAVILDLTIPGGMGGRRIIEILREMNPQAKVIASSGYIHGLLLPVYEGWGFDGVIAKPYQIEELSEILRKVIENGYQSPDIGRKT